MMRPLCASDSKVSKSTKFYQTIKNHFQILVIVQWNQNMLFSEGWGTKFEVEHSTDIHGSRLIEQESSQLWNVEMALSSV